MSIKYKTIFTVAGTIIIGVTSFLAIAFIPAYDAFAKSDTSVSGIVR